MPGVTWYFKILAKASLFSGFNRSSTVPSGKASKASLVGAKTMSGPAFTNTFSNSAACTAATKVVWSDEPIAIFSTLGVDPSSSIKAWPCFAFIPVSVVLEDSVVEALSPFLQADTRPSITNVIAHNLKLTIDFIYRCLLFYDGYTSAPLPLGGKLAIRL